RRGQHHEGRGLEFSIGDVAVEELGHLLSEALRHALACERLRHRAQPSCMPAASGLPPRRPTSTRCYFLRACAMRPPRPTLPIPIEMLSAIDATTLSAGERLAKRSNPKNTAAAAKPHSMSAFGHVSCLTTHSSILSQALSPPSRATQRAYVGSTG